MTLLEQIATDLAAPVARIERTADVLRRQATVADVLPWEKLTDAERDRWLQATQAVVGAWES